MSEGGTPAAYAYAASSGRRQSVDGSDLGGLLSELAELIPDQRQRVLGMLDQWRSQQIRVVVLGEAKRGKSSLINALLGRAVLPTGIVPVTSVLTQLRTGETDSATVRFMDGHEGAVPLDAIEAYIAEQRNPGNEKCVESVDLTVAGADWPASLVFIDTPGSGSVQTSHDATATAAAGAMDVAVLVLTGDPPISARELELLRAAGNHSAELLVVLTKVDQLTDDEAKTVIAYTEGVIIDQANRAVEVVAAAAKSPRDPHPGLIRLRESITSLGSASATRTLASSLSNRGRRLIDGALGELDVSLALVDMHTAKAEERAQLFSAALVDARAQTPFAAEVVRAGVKTLNAALDASAAERTATTRARLLDVARDQKGGVARAPAESAVLDELTSEATQAADEWRQASQEQVERALDDIGRRATRSLGAVVRDLRDAARDLLGVSLTIELEPIELPADSRFFYVSGRITDAATSISGLIRHGLPGRWRRRATSTYLREAATLLADRQVGRARGDLRTRLSAAERSLVSQVESRMRDLVDRLEAATGTAVELARQEGRQREARLGPLVCRRSRLQELSKEIAMYGNGAS
ncbi:MAG: dynamin family protein [Nocardioidaceae bacterium]